MTSLEALFQEVDKLERDELVQLYEYIEQKRRMQWWRISMETLQEVDAALVEVHAEAEAMSEDEINTLLDEVVHEVRC